jgi:C4-dicarboxylate-specific signal transduction histidine kinase
VKRFQAPRLDPALEKMAAEAAAAADASAEYPFDQIYTSAGIREPQHGFTVNKLVEMMQAEELRDLDGPTRAKVITGMLRRLLGCPVALDDIVRDAVQRDQALDAFERFLSERTARTEAELVEANRKLQAEVDELVRRNTEAMQANQARIEAERAKVERWRTRKRTEEERLFTAVQPFVEANPVTVGGIGGEPPATPGDPEVPAS